MGKTSYYLSENTFVCLADNHFVFLDLRGDRYLCLDRKHTDAIKGLLHGHLSGHMHSADIRIHGTGHVDAGAAVQALLQKGLLVKNDGRGKLPTPARVTTPSASMMEKFSNPRRRICPQNVWHFFSAAAIASADLRSGSIERTVRKIATRKSTHTTTATATNSSAISELFQIFCALRPYYPRKYLCLFDSLALLHFLARYEVFPQWVYGVKLEPFAAHCWVQVGDLVVNDIIDRVREYTPIMAI